MYEIHNYVEMSLFLCWKQCTSVYFYVKCMSVILYTVSYVGRFLFVFSFDKQPVAPEPKA